MVHCQLVQKVTQVLCLLYLHQQDQQDQIEKGLISSLQASQEEVFHYHLLYP